MQNFEFEQWTQLHSDDPEAFDRRREEALRAFIEQANPDSRQMLEQTLFTLQMHRQKSKSPLQSAIFASNLMWESFGKMRETMNEARATFETARPKLSVVAGKPMSQIDRIVTGWAAGVPASDVQPWADSDAKVSERLETVLRDHGGLIENSAPAKPEPSPARPDGSAGSAKIIAFPFNGHGRSR